MTRPRALDLFCGAGGAGMGLHRAGFEVVGVDCRPQPRYPFEFHQADAMTFPLDGFDFVWASPPCQLYSRTRKMNKNAKAHPDLVAPIRDRLNAWGGPYIIENVPGAPLLDPVMLAGPDVGLPVYRRRLFESNRFLLVPGSIVSRGRHKSGEWPCVCGNARRKGEGRAAWSRALGIDWMINRELTQAIPPGYSQLLASQIIGEFRA